MEWDRFDAYSKTIPTILQIESGKPASRELNLPEGQESTAEQSSAALENAFNRARDGAK